MAVSTVKKRVAGVAAAAILAVGSLAVASTDAPAQYRRHHGGGWNTGAGVAAGVVGGLALGALATGGYGYGGYGGYGGGYGAYGPAYYGGCYITRQRVWDGYGWVIQRVRVCE
jgi:hypothetical protein